MNDASAAPNGRIIAYRQAKFPESWRVPEDAYQLILPQVKVAVYVVDRE
jgi:hypothetical protein